MVIEYFSQDTKSILEKLKRHPKLQYAYLSTIMSNSSSSVMNELLTRKGIEITSEMHEIYIKLLCQFNPSAVYNYLLVLSDKNIRIEYCLSVCQHYEILDASTYLLERTGTLLFPLSSLLFPPFLPPLSSFLPPLSSFPPSFPFSSLFPSPLFPFLPPNIPSHLISPFPSSFSIPSRMLLLFSFVLPLFPLYKGLPLLFPPFISSLLLALLFQLHRHPYLPLSCSSPFPFRYFPSSPPLYEDTSLSLPLSFILDGCDS